MVEREEKGVGGGKGGKGGYGGLVTKNLEG